MAVTVPVYEQGQVRHNNLPGARYSDAGGNVAGEAVGQAIGRAGDMLGQIAEAEKQRVDTAAVMEAEAELRGQQNRMLFGDGTGKNIGAFGTKGKDAFGLPEQVLPAFEKSRTEIAGRLKGQQRAMFEQRTAGWGEQTNSDLLRHVAREADAYTKETTKAYIDSSAQTALLYYNDQAKVDGEVTRAQDAYLVGNPGDPPEATRLALQTIDSNVRRSIVNRMMIDSPSAAQAYYTAHKDQFIATDQADIERVMVPLVKANRGEQIGQAAITGTAGPEMYREAIASIESRGSGDYSAVGPATKTGDRGHGRYQVMGTNIPEWTKQALGRSMTKEEFLADPAAQDAVFDHRFGMYVKKYGAEGAARAWFGGEGAVNNSAAKDVLGTSVESYGKRFTAAIGSGQSRSYADAKQLVLDTVKDDDVRKSALSTIERQEAVTKQRAADQEKTISETLNRKVEQADPSTPFAKIATPEELAFAQEKGWVDKFEARLKERAGGGTQTTPRDQLLAYRAVAYNAARGDEASKHELSRYNPYDPKLTMSQQDRDWLAGQQKDILSGDPAKQAKAASEGEINNIIQTYAVNTLGVDKKKLGTDPAAIAFDRDMRLWADQFQRANNRAPTYTETLKHADLVTIEKMGYTRVEPGKIWDSKIETTVAELGIPKNMQSLIVDALYAENKPVNGANVAAKWRAYLKANK